MVDKATHTSRKRKKTARRVRKTGKRTGTARTVVPAEQATPTAPKITQVDVTEVTDASRVVAKKDAGNVVKKTARRRPKRTKKTSRRKMDAATGGVSPRAAVEAGASPASTTERGAAAAPPIVEQVSKPQTQGVGAKPGVKPTSETATAAQKTGRTRRMRKRKVSRSGMATPDVVVPKARSLPDAERPEARDRPAATRAKVAPADVKAERKTTRRSTSRHRRRAKVQEGEAVDRAAVTTERAESLEAQADERSASEDADEDRIVSGEGGSREMLINVSAGDECRVAILHEGRLEELFIERASTQSHVGNIYKARVTNTEPSIQAAFVDFGLARNGFLHISDVQPQYFPNHKGTTEEVGRKIPRHHRPPIQRCFRRGQEAIVQVTKEGVGTKGPTLTTYLSIPGRFLVMMPGMHWHGVSRKIEDEADRRSMREMLNQLDLPSDMGFIMRTAGLGRTKRELQRDLQYLVRLWKVVSERIKRLPAPAGLYQESDLVTRTIRDVYTADFARVIVDDAETAKTAREFLQIAMPRSKAPVELYTDREPLFHRYGIEEEIEKINMRHVPLPSGGSLVIDTTEALVAIDVNSGRFRTTDDAEESAFKINIEAAEEIARQLRLRDLGGLIVCDFIDMRLDRHQRAVERSLREAVKKHKERARILKMSAFGLIEMTRQRQGPSLKRNIYYDCPHCKGAGQVKMPDSVTLDVMRAVQLATHRDSVQRVIVTVASDVAFRILNRKRTALNQIELETGKEIIIRGDAQFVSDQMECTCEDARGRPVNVVSTFSQNAGTVRAGNAQ